MIMTMLLMMIITVGYTTCMHTHTHTQGSMHILLCTCLLLRGGLFVLFKRCCLPSADYEDTNTHVHTICTLVCVCVYIAYISDDPTCYFGCRNNIWFNLTKINSYVYIVLDTHVRATGSNNNNQNDVRVQQTNKHSTSRWHVVK